MEAGLQLQVFGKQGSRSGLQWDVRGVEGKVLRRGLRVLALWRLCTGRSDELGWLTRAGSTWETDLTGEQKSKKETFLGSSMYAAF